MGLNISNGNMYKFVSHTWNTVKGKCFHNCSYCYMKSLGHQYPLRFDKSELTTNLGKDNFIFVGSSNDLFAENIPTEWIQATIDHCKKYDQNKYLFQTKNPKRFNEFTFPQNCYLGITLETNRYISEIMGNSPSPSERVEAFSKIKNHKIITIEPIMDFDLDEFIELIRKCEPVLVIFGADSKYHNLPEPSKEKIETIVEKVKEFTKTFGKENILRLYK